MDKPLRGFCPECGRNYALRSDGTLRRHYDSGTGEACLGSGRGPAPEDEGTMYDDDYTDPAEPLEERASLVVRSASRIPTAGTLEHRRSTLARRISRLEAEIARLESLPEEPEADPAIVYFRKDFGGKDYDYAAVRAGDGLWYTTGPKSPKGYTWESLVGFIYPDGADPAEVEVWVVSDLERI